MVFAVAAKQDFATYQLSAYIFPMQDRKEKGVKSQVPRRVVGMQSPVSGNHKRYARKIRYQLRKHTFNQLQSAFAKRDSVLDLHDLLSQTLEFSL